VSWLQARLRLGKISKRNTESSIKETSEEVGLLGDVVPDYTSQVEELCHFI